LYLSDNIPIAIQPQAMQFLRLMMGITGRTGQIRFSYRQFIMFIYFMYNEELVRLYWGWRGGLERFTPPNPQETPRQPPGNPLGTSNKWKLYYSAFRVPRCDFIDGFVIWQEQDCKRSRQLWFYWRLRY